MITRKTTRLISELYEMSFRNYHEGGSYSNGYYTLNTTGIYDFLFDNDYASYFCNTARSMHETRGTRKFKEFIMKLHTGESLINNTTDWSWEQREKLGQQHLHDLATDIINYWKNKDTNTSFAEFYKAQKQFTDKVIRQLELDGYEYRDGSLLESEADILDIEEERGVIKNLHNELSLQNEKTTFHHLNLTEEHYIAERWDDSISNSRKFLESILQEISAAYNLRTYKTELSEGTYSRPVKIRDYLEKEGLIEAKEKAALAAIYGLLSNTGGHPYMAASDQARLLRHMALTLAQFAMLRFKGKLNQP